MTVKKWFTNFIRRQRLERFSFSKTENSKGGKKRRISPPLNRVPLETRRPVGPQKIFNGIQS